MNNKGAGPCTITLLLCAVEEGAQMYTENAGVRNMFKKTKTTGSNSLEILLLLPYIARHQH